MGPSIPLRVLKKRLPPVSAGRLRLGRAGVQAAGFRLSWRGRVTGALPTLFPLYSYYSLNFRKNATYNNLDLKFGDKQKA
jgi:hypothetical protein